MRRLGIILLFVVVAALALQLLPAPPARSQTQSVGAMQNLPNVFTAANSFSQGVLLGPVPVAQLPLYIGTSNTVVTSDGTASTPCVGGGTGALAVYIGGQWNCSTLTGGGGGGGVTSITCGTGLSGGTITTTGTCALLTALPNGTTATTQSLADNTNKVATDAFVIANAGGSGGTVTGFSAGNLSPLFTTSVATATTTPALTFSLTNAAANTIFANFTGSSAVPSYSTINSGSSCGDGTHALSYTNGTGFGCQAITVGTGTVTGVTGVAPIASTGGATPAISLQNSGSANVTAAYGTDTAYFTASGGASTSGDVMVGDTSGGIKDSGTLLSSLTGAITCSGTCAANHLAKFATSSTVNDSGLSDSGTVLSATELLSLTPGFGGTNTAVLTANNQPSSCASTGSNFLTPPNHCFGTTSALSLGGISTGSGVMAAGYFPLSGSSTSGNPLLAGVYGYASTTSGNAPTVLSGSVGLGELQSSGNVANVTGNWGIGYVTTGDTSGTVSLLSGVIGQVDNQASGATVTASAAFYAESPTLGATVTNNYGIYIADQTIGSGGGFNPSPYSLYAAGTAPSYFGGGLILAGISGTSPICGNGTGNALTTSGCTGGGGGVSSFTGDGTLATNSASTGAVTLTLGTAGAHKWWGNNTGSTAAPGYESLTASDIPTGIPIANVGSAGLSGTAPITISSAGVIACATCVTSAASLTSTAFMTGAGLQASQTPSATATLDSSGDAAFPGTLTASSGSTLQVSGATTAVALNVVEDNNSSDILHIDNHSAVVLSKFISTGALVPQTTNSIPLGGASNVWSNIYAGGLTVGVAGTLSGVVTLEGSISGAATFTAPAVAGTATNPITFSNAITLPTGSLAAPSLNFSGDLQTGIYEDGSGFLGFSHFGTFEGRVGNNGIQSTGTQGFGFTDNSTYNDILALRVSSGLFSIGTSGASGLQATLYTTPNVVSCTQATPCASTATNVIASAVNAMYRVEISVACSGAVSTATATITVAYTDPSSTAQTVAPATPAACTTLGTSSIASISQVISAKVATAITYAATTANSPNYQARVAVYQETLN